MCGFIGFIVRDAGTVGAHADRIARGLQFLRRRGPDSQKSWCSEDERVHLGFARLAIVDQDSSAHQPLTAAVTGLTVVLNGEIYNYDELRRELTAYPFRTQSDTEVLLAAFSAWGIAGLQKLRGMFASAIVDWRNERVYLLRDPVGKKPLFVRDDASDLVFGSSVLAIQAVSGEPVRLNDEAVKSFWQHEYVLPHESMLEACRPVMPGEVLEYDWDGRLLSSHSCRPKATCLAPTDAEEVHLECGRLIEQSVVRRLHNNPRPVSLLSGGIDSTLITQVMQSVTGGESITLASRLRLSPDERYARYAAERIGVPLQGVRMSLGTLAEDVQWAFSLQDEPLGMISFFMLAHLVKAAKDYGRILLTGDGGDEVFVGYGAPDDWTSGAATDDCNGEWTVGTDPQAWMNDWARFVVREQLLGHMFPKVDRAAAEQGVEIRSPLVDWDLFSFARQLPPDVLLHSGKMKWLLKQQLGDWPEWFLERPKVGFTFRLRWLWLLRGYAGIREMVSETAVDTFGENIPAELRLPSRSWTISAIFRNFRTVWKLIAWSEFERKLSIASRAAPQRQQPLTVV